MKDPVELINEAFTYYSDWTETGRAAAPGNWNILVNNIIFTWHMVTAMFDYFLIIL